MGSSTSKQKRYAHVIPATIVDNQSCVPVIYSNNTENIEHTKNAITVKENGREESESFVWWIARKGSVYRMKIAFVILHGDFPRVVCTHPSGKGVFVFNLDRKTPSEPLSCSSLFLDPKGNSYYVVHGSETATDFAEEVITLEMKRQHIREDRQTEFIFKRNEKNRDHEIRLLTLKHQHEMEKARIFWDEQRSNNISKNIVNT